MRYSEFKHIVYETFQNIKEDQGGIKPTRGALGLKRVRIIIEGEEIYKNKDLIENLLAKLDPEHNVKYYESTNKYVGTFLQSKIKVLNNKLGYLDLKAKEKPQSKSLKPQK